MLRRLSRRAVETLEFRGVLVALAVLAALIVYFALFAGHRPKIDSEGVPSVPPGDSSPPSRV